MDFCICIANRIISIHSVYTNIYRACKGYVVNGNTDPDIEIRIDDQMLGNELEVMQRSGNAIPGLGSLEGNLIHRLVAEAMLEYNTFLMHGAVVSVDGAAYLFSGRSGTGKTTHIKKWIDNAAGSFIVNGDKPLIAVKPEGVFACGTPWRGKEYFGENTIVPLRSIVLMERNEENIITEISFKTAFPKLLEQTYRPDNDQKMRKTLDLLNRLKGKVSFYHFAFNNLKNDAFQVSYNALAGKGL